MKTVWITRKLPQPVLDAARARFDVTVRDETRPVALAEMREALARYDAILPTLGDALGADAFKSEVRTSLLANLGVGTNHIDVAAARAAGVAVTNTPGAVTEATADIALMLMLMTARRAGEGERMVRAGKWEGWHPTQLLGMHLGGRTLGIVGMGRIGKAIARRAQAGLGMEVVFFNRSPVAEPGVPAEQVPTLAELAARADVVAVAVPGGAETRHLIDKGVLAAMKPEAILVNISRGDVVDEAALVAALEAGRIGGAGLDVYENEPEVSPGLLRENVTLLPHLGTAALSVRTDMGMMAVENLIAWDEGRELQNPV